SLSPHQSSGAARRQHEGRTAGRSRARPGATSGYATRSRLNQTLRDSRAKPARDIHSRSAGSGLGGRWTIADSRWTIADSRWTMDDKELSSIVYRLVKDSL